MLLKSTLVGARSTTLPAYITMISSVRVATTPRSCVTRIMAMFRSRCSWESRSRIWACTVTSRPVVGSSANSRRGAQASAMAIMTRWRMPPGQLGRVGLVALDGRGDADLHEEGERRLLGLGLGELQVDLERFRDLVADPLHRVERRHRVLEHHGHVGAPQLAQLVVGRVEDLRAVVADGARLDGGEPGEQAHDGPRQHRLAGTGLADDPEGLPLLQGERDPLHGPEVATAGGEGDVEVLDLEERCVGHSLISDTSK